MSTEIARALIHIYHIPTEIIFGPGSTRKIGEKIQEFNSGKPLIITDNVIKKIGLTEKIFNSMDLEPKRINLYELPPIEPTTKSVQEAMDFVRQGGYDTLVAVGGGSVMDSAKLAAHGASTEGSIEDYISGKVALERGIPLITVPTTSGTGAEISGGSMIKIDKGYKIGVGVKVPDVAIVDPTMTVTLPPDLTAGCAMDALSHAVEPLLSKDRFNPLRDAYTMEATRLIFNHLRTAYNNGEDLDARSNLAIASTMAGMSMCISNSGWPAHCFAEVFGPIYEIPHGIACALALPYLMKFNLPACTDELSRLANAMGENVGGLSKLEAAEKSVEAVEKLLIDVGLPTSLRDLGIPKSDLPKLAGLVEKDYIYIEPSMMEYSACELTGEMIKRLLQDMWEGKL